MELPDKTTCYKALQSKDARFDGLIFVGVKSTKIYCRPVCPARTARFENCTFYGSAAAAQEAGFRPCLRCRPETAPQLASWRGTSNTVSRGLEAMAGVCGAAFVGCRSQNIGNPGKESILSLFFKSVDTPIGKLKLVASHAGLVAILWENDSPRRVPLQALVEDDQQSILVETARQLQEYFAGGRSVFSIPLDMRGTAFQKDVWRALQAIPFGKTSSYGEIAIQVGRPAASRAVGAANGRNPISIVVPCHRVIGSTGKLTGFAGGLQAKAHLLGLESTNNSLF